MSTTDTDSFVAVVGSPEGGQLFPLACDTGVSQHIWHVLSSYLLAGIPADLLDSYPAVKEFRNSIASLPEVAAFYE